MTKHSLSLCMIVKDAEETVGRAIKSALAVVDEVVVVDTGSTDNTRLIVEGYGARVVDFPWCDDFSAARNAGIAAAYGDWILVLDADEVLESIRPVEIGRLLSNDSAIAYYARVRNEAPGRASTVSDKVRLFRSHPTIRYQYPIHEQIIPSITGVAEHEGGIFLPSPLSIVHFGGVERDEKGKRSRNQRLLSRAIEGYPEQPYFRYQLACEMALYLNEIVLPVKGFTQMLHELTQAVRLVRAMPREQAGLLAYGPDLFSRHAAALLSAGKPSEALASADDGIERFGEGSLLRFHRGLALLAVAAVDERLRTEHVAQAILCMQRMLKQADSLEPAPISAAYFQLYPHRYLGLAALAEGRTDAAKSHFDDALRCEPAYTGALCGLARVADARGKAKEALQIYLRALSLNESEVEAWLSGSELLVRLGFGDNALSWLQKLSNFVPEHPRIAVLMGRIESERTELAGR